ncbi:hypothetical protein [Bradyrhizobium prioriisuperbiae]|uniref:hypothetical protein n=1 Tax=Bradyrhizobium prioriisuperbiae TaxID=2854389 RepID=UPI0028EB34D4|nr:hypothetical protein [Bradyrhizobium prioritasuperba]
MSEKQSGSSPALSDESRKPRLLNRRLAAIYVGVTMGRFEQLVREDIIPEPIVIDRNRLWDICLLDRAIDALRQQDDLPVNAAALQAAASPQPPCASGHGMSAVSHPLPDQAWLQNRSSLVCRVGKSLLSHYEINVLREFKVRGCDEISMFGFYRTFEALMARGLVMELSRRQPSSRPLVTYRLTVEGAKIVAAMRGN